MMGDRATIRSALCARPRSEGEMGHNDEGQNNDGGQCTKRRATKRSALCARPRSEGEWGHNDEGQNDKTQSECIRKDKNIHNEVLPHVSDPRIMAKHINTH